MTFDLTELTSLTTSIVLIPLCSKMISRRCFGSITTKFEICVSTILVQIVFFNGMRLECTVMNRKHKEEFSLAKPDVTWLLTDESR